jgi:hypothetical protein
VTQFGQATAFYLNRVQQAQAGRPFSRPEQTNRGPKLERSAEKRKNKKKRKSNSKAGFIAIWTRERDREQSNMESVSLKLIY